MNMKDELWYLAAAIPAGIAFGRLYVANGWSHSILTVREVSRHSLGLIHGHVANRRAAKRAQALTRP